MNAVPRKTIARETILEGVGLHSGASVRLTLAPFDGGIVFVRTDLPGAPRLALSDVFADAPPLRTALKKGSTEVHTIEHLLSALAGLGLTDLECRLDGVEVPGMDGSALPFAVALHEAGSEPLDGSLEPIRIREEIRLAEGEAGIVARPGDGFCVRYELFYPGEPLAQGEYAFAMSEAAYLNEIAPARTLCLRREAEQLRAAGFGKGANTSNTLVLDGGKVLDTTLRFPNEPVRHKILDLLGDLYLLGRPVCGRIEARRSGHRLNRQLAARLAQQAKGA